MPFTPQVPAPQPPITCDMTACSGASHRPLLLHFHSALDPPWLSSPRGSLAADAVSADADSGGAAAIRARRQWGGRQPRKPPRARPAAPLPEPAAPRGCRAAQHAGAEAAGGGAAAAGHRLLRCGAGGAGRPPPRPRPLAAPPPARPAPHAAHPLRGARCGRSRFQPVPREGGAPTWVRSLA